MFNYLCMQILMYRIDSMKIFPGMIPDTTETVRSILDGGLFDVVLFDCDGVLFQADHVLPGASETLSLLEQRGIHRKVITNSSTKSQETLYDKLTSIGITAISSSDCYPSGVCAAEYLRSEHPTVRTIYVVGAKGLVAELERVGFEVIGGPEDDNEVMTDARFVSLGDSETEARVDAVVVGYDMNFNFFKLGYSSLCFQKNPGCVFVGTNDDVHDRIGGRWLVPANGSVLASVTRAVNGLDSQLNLREPVIVGKPNALFGNLVLQRSGLKEVDPSRVLMIGDKIETDVRLAKNCGFKSCLVLSGCATKEDLVRVSDDDKPDFVLNGLCDFLHCVE